MIAFLLLGTFGFPNLAGSTSLLTFPDRKAFDGIKIVVVSPITFTNMENVKVDPEALRESVKKKLDKDEIGIMIEESLQSGDVFVEGASKDVGLLKIAIRRWETSGPMGMTMNSFAITLQFFQKALVRSSQHEAWVITWFETKSVIVGTKRTKGIEDALEELVQAFLLKFKERSDPS